MTDQEMMKQMDDVMNDMEKALSYQDIKSLRLFILVWMKMIQGWKTDLVVN